MALNFRINRRKKDGHLYFRLTGDFDGASALELVRALSESTARSKKIVIDTCGLSSIQAFGQDVFFKHCALAGVASPNLVFCGTHGGRMAPKGASHFGQEKDIVEKPWQ